MARQSGIFNVDGGLWFDLKLSQGIGVFSTVAAARYANLNSFQTLLTNGTTWSANQWGDQTKRLGDSRYGYKIIDSIWTEPKIDENPWTGSSLAANPIGGNIVTRSFVLKSLDSGQYIYVNPATVNNSPSSVQFSYVNSHHEAYRFTDFVPVINWITGSVLGDGSAGFALEQYYFTKAVTNASYSYFSGPATLSNAVERAFVPFSKEKGQYLVIENPDAPPVDMIFNFTPDFYAGARFTDLNDFQDILDQTFLGNEVYGWEIPQFVFTRIPKPPKGNPFDVFWCDDQNGPYNCIGYEMPTCDWLCRTAIIFPFDFREYLNQVIPYLLSSKCYPDQKAFEAWWAQQDYAAFEQWLFEFWKTCIENNP
jgi:hypothetical protein